MKHHNKKRAGRAHERPHGGGINAVLREFLSQDKQAAEAIRKGRNPWNVLHERTQWIFVDGGDLQKARAIDRQLLTLLHLTDPTGYVRAELIDGSWRVYFMETHDGHANTLKVWVQHYGSAPAIAIEGLDLVLSRHEYAQKIVVAAAMARAGDAEQRAWLEEMERKFLPWTRQQAMDAQIAREEKESKVA